jgi:hypothetical protein
MLHMLLTDTRAFNGERCGGQTCVTACCWRKAFLSRLSQEKHGSKVHVRDRVSVYDSEQDGRP